MMYRIRSHSLFYLFLLPAIATVLVFAYVPMLGVVMAFQDFHIVKGFTGSDFVGLDNFRAFLDSPDFYRALRNTLVMSVLLIVIGFPLPIAFAILINEMKNRLFKRITQTITYLPHFISWVVIAGIIYRLLDQEGSVNAMLAQFGFEKEPFMREPGNFWAILVSSSIWKDIGWNSIIYLAAIAGIDQSLYEAATVDGAGRLKKILFVTLPGIMPVAGLLFILTMGSLVNGANFDAIYNLSNPLVASRSVTLDYFVYLEGIRNSNPGFAAAVGLTFSLVSFGLVLTANLIGKRISGNKIF